MSTRRFMAALAAFMGCAVIGFGTAPAKAGGGCWSECEERPPVVYKKFKKRIQVEPGVYEVVRVPSVYGWATPIDPRTKRPIEGYPPRRVLLKPYKNIAIYNRARHVYTKEHVAVEVEPYGTPRWWHRFFD
jgi:hypothetical protein